MELLLRQNSFDIHNKPAAGGGLFDPLRYLSLGGGAAAGGHQPEVSREDARTKQTSPANVYEVAKPILQGCHAVPTKLKILLDRALSVLCQEEVVMIITSCGWHLEDYQRGYKLKDASGNPLDRWNMCNKLEEPIILQQFLMFQETRTITQQLIIQDLTERSNFPFLDKTRCPDVYNKLGKTEEEKFTTPTKMSTESPVKAPESLLKMVAGYENLQKEERREVESPRSSVDTGVSPPVSPRKQSSPPVTSTPPSSAGPLFPRSMSNGIPLPPSSMSMSNLMSNHFPIFPFPGLPGTMTGNQPKEGGKDHFTGALNLSRPEKGSEKEFTDVSSDTGSRRSSVDTLESHNQNRKITPMPEDLGIPYVSPTTGKKRVQCQVCMKTFCDKGALKIHFSAVHLREMHRCTVKGCTMMFSSRRSRNRHSANPNPKLHTPQVKRRISAHDGRTHQGPLIPSVQSSPTPPHPILPKENREITKENNFPVPNLPAAGHGTNNSSSGRNQIAFPGLPGFNPFMPPDLKAFQQDLQRFSELHKLYANKAEQGDTNSSDSEVQRANDSMNDSSNRKRKSQHPTKRPHLDMEENDHISSDSASDEGFPDPMMEDDDDDLDNVSSGDEN